MKMSNEEKVSAYETARNKIVDAIDEIRDIKEYIDVYCSLEDVVEMLDADAEEFVEAYRKDQQAELDYQNSEYMRSVI